MLQEEQSVEEEQRRLETLAKLKQESDEIRYEMVGAEDKLTTTLYTLKAGEKDLAINVVDALKTLQEYFKENLDILTRCIPDIEKKVMESKKTRVYGETLETHLK